MKDATKNKRKDQIEAAAYRVLRARGYKGASMLAIAKEAGASNETLYRWYGTKAALFAALVRSNAAEIEAMLTRALANGSAPLDCLARVGPELLLMVTSERAISLNRAAAADVCEDATLGRAIAQEGRERIAPLLGNLFAKAVANGDLAGQPAEIADVYLRQLIGDVQVRRVIGVQKELNAQQAETTAQFALATISKLYS